jgi:hypothetical protein
MRPFARHVLEALWALTFAAHALAAALVWVVLPGGFAADHPRFWVNRALPAALLAAFPAMWAGAAVSARIIFPRSAGALWILLVYFAALKISTQGSFPRTRKYMSTPSQPW